MASNLEYLEGKLQEAKSLASQYRSKRDAELNKRSAVQSQLNSEIAYYSSLSAINIKKRKESEARQASLKTEIAKIDSQIQYWNQKIKIQDVEIQDIESKIDAFLNAVNEGTSQGLKAEDALEFANQATNAAVTEMQAKEQTEAEATNAEMTRKLLIWLGVIFALGIIGFFLYRYFKKKKKS